MSKNGKGNGGLSRNDSVSENGNGVDMSNSHRSSRKKTNRIVLLIVCLCIGAPLVALLGFFYSEKQREKIFASYRAPSSIISFLASEGERSVATLMMPNESVVCAIDSYASIDNLSDLNFEQRHSLPKEKLPSEDLTWYLLFFSQERIERVYWIEGVYEGRWIEMKRGHVCIGRSGLLRVTRNGQPNKQFFSAELVVAGERK